MSHKILILGASSDMGMALIQAIDGNYDEIICHYHSSDKALLELQKTLKTPLKMIQADFSSVESTKALTDQIALISDLKAVVHFPSVKLDPKAFRKTSWADTQTLIDVSVRSAYEVLKAILPAMTKARSGKIVFVLSSVTSGPSPAFMNGYVTSKYALLGLMKSLAAEMAPYQVCLNAVSPSLVETRFVSELPELTIALSADHNPMKRNAKLEDIIPSIKFLLSDEAGFISGQNIVISGGEH